MGGYLPRGLPHQARGRDHSVFGAAWESALLGLRRCSRVREDPDMSRVNFLRGLSSRHGDLGFGFFRAADVREIGAGLQSKWGLLAAP